MQNRYSLANEISYFKFDSVVAAQKYLYNNFDNNYNKYKGFIYWYIITVP